MALLKIDLLQVDRAPLPQTRQLDRAHALLVGALKQTCALGGHALLAGQQGAVQIDGDQRDVTQGIWPPRTSANAAAMSSPIMRRLLFSIKKLGPACVYDGKARRPRQV